jgi:hypothetical protein
MIKSVLLVTSLFVTVAAAQEVGAPAPIHIAYSGYSHGFNVIDLDAVLTMTPVRYRLETNFMLAGVLGALFHADGKTIVNGRFVGTRAEPDDLFSTGHFRGDPRVTQMSWRNGVPTIIQMQPPVETERDVVPANLQTNTIDSLSAMAALIHQVAMTGKCDGKDRTFDGRRLSEVAAHTVGQEVLEKTSRSSFAGAALRCDFEGKQLAGFRRDADQNELGKPNDGSAWFAQVTPGGPPIPVRVTFSTPQFGDTTMYMTSVH